MLKLIFLTIILYIIIQHFIEQNNPTKPKNSEKIDNFEKKKSKKLVHWGTNINNQPINNQPFINNQPINNQPINNQPINNQPINNQPINNQPINNQPINNQLTEQVDDKVKTIDFNKPNPWTKIIINPTEEFQYLFYIKANVPSLNDFENWKQIIPNINFEPRTGELIIPSKDEPSALALVNLILINFSGQMSLENILEKNLIQISITKAKTHELVQTKLREQIMENLYGNQFNSIETNYKQDLASTSNNLDNDMTNSIPTTYQSNNRERLNFKSDSFVDTFQHYSSDSNIDTDVGAWDGSDFSYL